MPPQPMRLDQRRRHHPPSTASGRVHSTNLKPLTRAYGLPRRRFRSVEAQQCRAHALSLVEDTMDRVEPRAAEVREHGRDSDDNGLWRARLSTSDRATPVAGAAAHPWRVDLIGERSKPEGAIGTHRSAVQARARKASSPSEARIGLHLPPADRMGRSVRMGSGCTRTGLRPPHRRPVTRERMAVLCRGSND